MSRFLNPYIALDQFNTGFEQQSSADARRKQLALEASNQDLQRSRFLQDQNQFNATMGLHRDQMKQADSHFDQSNALGQGHLALAQAIEEDRLAQQAQLQKERGIKTSALREFVRRRANQLRQDSGVPDQPAGPDGFAGPPMPGAMPPASHMIPGEVGQDDRPTSAPQLGEPGYQSGEPVSGMAAPAPRLNQDQAFSKSIADMIDNLDVEGLPPEAVMHQIDEYTKIAADAQKKRQAMEFWKSKGPRWEHKVQELQADLSASEMTLLEKEAERKWSIDPHNPEVAQEVAQMQALSPRAHPAQVQAYVLARRQGLVNQAPANLTGEVKQGPITSDPEYLLANSRYEAALKKYEAVTKGLPNPETLKPIEAQLDLAQKAREAVLMKRMSGGAGAQQPAAGEDLSSGPVVIDGKQGTVADAGGIQTLQGAWKQAIDTFTQQNGRPPGEKDRSALVELRNAILKQAHAASSK